MARRIFPAAVALCLTVFTFVGGTQEAAKAPPRGGVEGRLTWFDRQGRKAGTVAEPGLYRTLSISPDGNRVAFERNDPQTQNRDIWWAEVGGGRATRFTSDPGWDAFPTWSPDGNRIIFTSNRGGVYDLYEKAVTGGADEKLFYQSMDGKGLMSWSSDGKFLLYYSLGQPTHVRLLAATGAPGRQPVPVVDPQFTSVSPRFSPDGRWIAYASNESGSNEVSVRSFDSATGAMGAPVVITRGGGRAPLWRGDSKEIFYITGDGMATAAEVQAGASFRTGPPKPLFPVPAAVLFWDVAPDGSRFLIPVSGP